MTYAASAAETLTISSPTVVEGTGAGTTTMNFVVTSPAAVQGGFTVAFAAADITATVGGGDYSDPTTSPFPTRRSSDLTQTISVNITRDAILEPNETFKITLGTVTAAT